MRHNEHTEAAILDAIQQEREACATMVENLADSCCCKSDKRNWCECFGFQSIDKLADAIRRRGKSL